MEKLLGTILTIIIIFYAVRIIFRLLMPLLLKLFMHKIQKKMNEQGGAFYTNMNMDDSSNSYAQHEEGDVTVQYKSNRKKTNDKGQTMSEELGGEYVDFEEVK